MTPKITRHNLPGLALLISGGLLAGAYLFEHVGGYAPCQMCYWQRYAHMAVIAIALLACLQDYVIKSPNLSKLFRLLIMAAFLVSFGLAFWHVGVEYGWWEGPKSCMASAERFSPDDLMRALSGEVEMPACTDAPWHFLGLSMAAYNAIISAFGAVFCVLSLRGEKS